jgi:hypothetical protein
VNGTRGGEFAAIEVKRLYAKHSGVVFRVRLEKFPKHTAGDITTARERDVRMPGTQISFESDSQGCFLHPFVNLKEMGMSFPNTNPNDFRRTFGWKRSDALDGKKEGAKLNRAQFFVQRKIDIFSHVGKEAESEMHLLELRPADTANVRIKIDK